MRAAGERTAEDVLEARARRLARPAAETVVATSDDLELLVVRVGAERVGIPLSGIVAIARASRIAPLPRAEPPVFGVTAWRGRPLTVLSLAGPQAPRTEATRLVVLGSGSRAALALMVEAVDDVECVAHASLSAAGAGPRRRHALGVTPAGLLVLSVDALLRGDALAT